MLERQLAAEVEFPAEARALISPALEAVLRRALEKDPERRYPDARSFASAFEEAICALVSDAAGGQAPSAPTELEPPGDPGSAAVRRCRRELVAALHDGDADLVIVACLVLADALIVDNRMLAAVQELEGALGSLLPRCGALPRSVWRIEMLLAAMHDRLGNPIRARRAAMDAHAHAVRSGDKVAERHAGALMRRLLANRGPVNPDCSGEPGIRDGARTLLMRRR